MGVWASRGARAGRSSLSRSNHGSMPESGIKRLRMTWLRTGHRPALAPRLRSLEQEVRGLAVLADERERPDDRDQQPLRVHVAGLDVRGLDLAGEHVLHLLA